MKILSTSGWDDYELIDSGNGQRLEWFGKYTLIRPDPQIIWQKQLSQNRWDEADAVFKRTKEDSGIWQKKKPMPDKWLMRWNDLSFWVKLTPFKHTGIFPEQVVQWEWLQDGIAASLPYAPRNDIRILNLFAYTGIASLVAAKAGASVTHVDASKPAITWARENQIASNLQEKPIRWIPDDALKFVQREIKRGVKYDGILMDPPVFGHGPICMQLLSDNPLFILINAYAISSSALMLENVLGDFTKHLGGKIESGELALQAKNSNRLLSTGIFAKWQSINLDL